MRKRQPAPGAIKASAHQNALASWKRLTWSAGSLADQTAPPQSWDANGHHCQDEEAGNLATPALRVESSSVYRLKAFGGAVLKFEGSTKQDAVRSSHA